MSQLREQPVIAITGELTFEPERTFGLRSRYGKAVQRAGAIALGLLDTKEEQLAPLLARVDGVLLPGSDDFDTAALGLGATHPRANPVPAQKQAFDMTLARALLAAGDVPVLGICYGMQLLGLAAGGRLYQHLPADRPGCRAHDGDTSHAVFLEKGSKLRALLEISDLEVNSRHHQALAEIAPPWIVSARDDEGLIEAIEWEGHPFALGVQFHPELGQPGDAALGIFEGFVAAARERAAKRRQRTIVRTKATAARAREAGEPQ